MELLKCKAGQLLAEIDGGYWVITPTHGKLFCGVGLALALEAWRWYVQDECGRLPEDAPGAPSGPAQMLFNL